MKQFLLFIFSIVTLSVTAQSPKRAIKKLGNDPVFFIDSVNVDKEELGKYNPQEIATVSVYKGKEAIALVGPEGKDGAVYIETKTYGRTKYIRYFSGKSSDYAKIVDSPQKDSCVQYILNKRILKDNFEGDLSLIDDKTFKSIKVIDKTSLQKMYQVMDKQYGVIVESSVPENLYHGNKKF
jgi:hypothetical protein